MDFSAVYLSLIAQLTYPTPRTSILYVSIFEDLSPFKEFSFPSFKGLLILTLIDFMWPYLQGVTVYPLRYFYIYFVIQELLAVSRSLAIE